MRASRPPAHGSALNPGGPRTDALTVGPSDFLIYVCRDCGGFDWAWEEIQHRSVRCAGRNDVTRIQAVIAEAREVVPIARVDVAAEPRYQSPC
jgi:hypothetical protein